MVQSLATRSFTCPQEGRLLMRFQDAGCSGQLMQSSVAGSGLPNVWLARGWGLIPQSAPQIATREEIVIWRVPVHIHH